tara:strand:- start:164 stop:712 length:549 start_codon:yes stop_codon:yes gene_type:complete
MVKLKELLGTPEHPGPLRKYYAGDNSQQYTMSDINAFYQACLDRRGKLRACEELFQLGWRDFVVTPTAAPDAAAWNPAAVKLQARQRERVRQAVTKLKQLRAERAADEELDVDAIEHVLSSDLTKEELKAVAKDVRKKQNPRLRMFEDAKRKKRFERSVAQALADRSKGLPHIPLHNRQPRW